MNVNMHLPADLLLETSLFQLRPLNETDLPELNQYAENEPHLWRYALSPVSNREEMELYVQDAISDWQKGTAFPFVVVDKNTGTIAGSTRYYELKPHHGSTLIGYTWYGTDYQGKGINAHCKFLLLQHAFEIMQLERVELRADTRNLRSLAAMRKCGFTEEGILRSHLPTSDGTRRDSIIFSMLKKEWENEAGEQLLERIKIMGS